MSQPLAGRRIALPESRELDLFVEMLERSGAQAVRCPLVSIRDVQDPAPVEAWIRRLAAGEHDDLVLYTGEGLTRLHGAAARAGIEAGFVEGLRRARKIMRGPKPARVLRTLSLAPDVAAEVPTTEGLIATLSGLDLGGRLVGVQLYPNHNDAILDFLRGAGATADPVVPYRYASDEEDGRVVEMLHAMAAGEIDMIALTSTPQVRRLKEVATKHGLAETLRQAAERTVIAAVGPVTGGRLAGRRNAGDELPSEAAHRRHGGRAPKPRRRSLSNPPAACGAADGIPHKLSRSSFRGVYVAKRTN